MPINAAPRLHPIFPNLFRRFVPFLLFCLANVPEVLPGQATQFQPLQSAKTSGVETVAKTDSFCGRAFFKRLLIQGQSVAGYKMVPASNTNFFIAASVGEKTMIALADKNMDVIWAKSLDMGTSAESILDMRMDADGQLIGVGNTSSSIIECFAFKINAADGQLIWFSKLNDPGNSYFTRILEKNSGENYLLFGQTDLVGTGNNSGCDALLIEIDRNTGELLWDKHYDLGSCEVINDVVVENNQIYICGRYNLVNGGQSRFRSALTLFDMAGNVQWSRHYLRNSSQDARMYFSSLVHEKDSLVALGWGDESGVSLTATTLQLVKTDLSGAANWAKKYDITGGNEERATRLIPVADGYLMFGTFVRPNAGMREICLIKTNKNGAFLWGKSYGGNGEERLNDVILVADTLYLIGATQNGQIFDMLVGKLDLDGNVDTTCAFVKNLNVTVSDYLNPIDDLHNLAELDITHNYATAPLPAPAMENVTTEVICQKICDNSCDKPDAGVFINSMFCATGSLSVQLYVYNSGAVPLPAGTLVSLYDGDPTTTNANLLVTFPTGAPIDTGSNTLVNFDVLNLLLPTDPNLMFYAVVNDNGSLNTPFSLGDLANSGLEECDYSNNMGSYTFAVPQPPTLNIGPDTAICSAADVTIQAGPGFFQYRWQDDSANPFYTATAPGTYWVEVTDHCGFRQIDSVVVTLLPPVEETRIIEFCPGDSVFIDGTFYTQPGTVTNTIPGVGGDCDTVVTYTLVLDISFLKILGAGNSDEAALGVYDAKDGNLYVSGVVGGDSLAIIKMTPAGDILWSDRINFLNGQMEYISELIVDDEGMIVGSGTMEDGSYSTGFVFRYDPAAHALLWAKRITFQCQILGILQKPNTGNYRIYLSFINPLATTNAVVLWDVNKATGTSILATHYRYALDTADVIRNMVLDGDKIYAVGGYTFQGFGVGGRRHALTCFDLDGNVEWSRLGTADQSAVQRLIGNDLIIDNQHIISVYSGDDDGISLDSTTIFLQKNTLDGDLVWVRKFDLGAGFSNEIVEEVVKVADGYVLMGRNRSGPGDLFFLKTDKEGHLLWAKKLDIADDNFASLGRDQSQLLAFDNGLYFAAKTQNATGKSDMVIGRMNLKGETGLGCDFIQPLQVTEITVGNPQNIPVNLLKLPHGATNSDYTVPPVPAPITLAVKNICSGCESPGCDTIQIAQTVELCPGDTVLIGAEAYAQPGTVFDTIPGTGTDCDTVVTYSLQFYQNSMVDVQCPVNITVEAAPGANTAVVNYNVPTATTDCPCGDAALELLQGQPGGSNFPVGATQVCYEASDHCGGTNSCCFTVTVQATPPEEACDVKITPCVKFEILGIFQNPAQQKTYRMRVTNACANKLIYTTFQLPNGVVADAPATNTTYTAPSGRQFEVRNPNAAPEHSIRFKTIGDGIANGESDIFEYTLPPQAAPVFIHATARLDPQVYYETHLNIFDCPVQQTSNRPAETVERQGISNLSASEMTIFPNPASDVLNVRKQNWGNQQIELRVTDAYGRLMFEQTSNSDSNLLTLKLPKDWPAGIYYLEAVNESGERQAGRFVRVAQR